jgi:hypothetical protein
LVLGAVALLARKGGSAHRRSGLLFVYVMLLMGAGASILAFRRSPSDVMLLAAAGDVRILRFGVPRGGPRLARHLWRMCFALFIAAGSFFSIRERVATILPGPFTTAPMRALPILLLFGSMFYWLWRLRGRRALPVLVRHDSVPLATGAK